MEELEEGLKVVGARGDEHSMPKGSCAGPESMSTALECMSSSSHLAFVNHVTVGNRLTFLSLVFICPPQWWWGIDGSLLGPFFVFPSGGVGC